MTIFSGILDDFQADIERVENLLKLINAFKDFGGAGVPVDIEAGRYVWDEAKDLSEFSKNRRTDLPIMSGSLVLYMAGRFEYFMRQLIEGVIDEICTRFNTFEELPGEVRAAVREKTLDIAQNPSRYGFTEAEVNLLLDSLTKNINGELSPPVIHAKILSITDANMKERVIVDLMKRIGMENFWKEVGKQATLKIHLESAEDGLTTKEATQRLNTLMEERNQIAHPTSATTFPDTEQVLKHADFLRCLADVIVDVVSVYLVSVRKKT